MDEFGMVILSTMLLVIVVMAGIAGWKFEPGLRPAIGMLVPIAVCLYAVLVYRWLSTLSFLS